MDTDKLRYFSAIAETGSLTKASQILNISHSGLSKAVSALENETKLKLFQPQGRGLEITQDGKWFYQKAQDILRIANEIALGRKSTQQTVRVGMSGVLAITCAGALAAELSEAVTIHETDIGDIEGKIIADEIDFGIAFAPSPKPELEYLELGIVRFNSYAHKDLIEKYPGAEIPYAVPTSDFPFNPLGYKIRDGWPADVARNPRFAVNSFAIALDLLREAQAAIYAPDFVAAQENSRQPRSGKILAVTEQVEAETKRKVFMVKRQAAEESKAMKKAAKVIRKVCLGR